MVGPRILIIDDDTELSGLLRELLTPEGYLVDTHPGGRDAAGVALAGEYGLVILDVMLPEVNGFDVLRAIRDESSLPVILLTARGDEVDRIVGLEIGADDYLPKPFEPRELLATQQAIEVTRLANQSGLMTQVAEEPARIREINNAVNIERFGWLDYFARAMGSIAMIVLAGGVLMILYVRTEPKKQPIEEPEPPFIIPLNVDTSDGGWRATRAEVPVDMDTLKLFADGIMQGNTPAYDVWQGVIKRPDLSQIRGFLLRELMAQKVKGEEVTIIQKGRDFLMHVSETGECPLPYRCIEPRITTPAAVDTSNVATETVGEPEFHPL